jgi:GNAT superfamily N-acetyltransferase
MATLTIRQATPDNALELARLQDLFDHMGATPEQVAARMLACQNVLTTFIGVLDGQPAGFACLRLIPLLQGDEPYAELTDIYLDAPFRREGVARVLIAHVEAAARAAGAGGLVIITDFDNTGAQAAYRASGYAN